MISEIVDPPDRLQGASSGDRRDRSPRTPPPRWRPRRRRCGAPSKYGLTDACKAGAEASRSRCGATPIRTEGPAAFAEKRDPDWQLALSRNDARWMFSSTSIRLADDEPARPHDGDEPAHQGTRSVALVDSVRPRVSWPTTSPEARPVAGGRRRASTRSSACSDPGGRARCTSPINPRQPAAAIEQAIDRTGAGAVVRDGIVERGTGSTDASRRRRVRAVDLRHHR